MAITTVSGLKDGLQPPFHFCKGTSAVEGVGIYRSTFYLAGDPAAAAAPTPGLNGTSLTSYAGQIPWSNPASGNAYLASMVGGYFEPSSPTNGMLLDRLWHNDIVVTTTTEQGITSTAWPSRDRGASTNGDGVFIGLEASTATTNAGAITNTTLNYTNSAGTAGRVGTITSVNATLAAGTFYFFHLDAGDIGVRSIQGVTLGTSYVSGTLHLVAVRVICDFRSLAVGDIRADDAFAVGFPRLYDDSVLFLLNTGHTGTSSPQMVTLAFAHG